MWAQGCTRAVGERPGDRGRAPAAGERGQARLAGDQSLLLSVMQAMNADPNPLALPSGVRAAAIAEGLKLVPSFRRP